MLVGTIVHVTLGGLIAGAAVFAVTGSVWWGVVGLVGFGVLVNSVVRPRPRVPQGGRR